LDAKRTKPASAGQKAGEQENVIARGAPFR
jgi:hypothetical protein